MIPAPSLPTQLPPDRRSHSAPCGGVIHAHFSSAERELAGEYWVALAEGTHLMVDGCVDWRRITIKAASRIAIERYTSAA
jgi:hypothetical protein